MRIDFFIGIIYNLCTIIGLYVNHNFVKFNTYEYHSRTAVHQ
jgi:hypothetical protein